MESTSNMPRNCNTCNKLISPEVEAVRCAKCLDDHHAVCANLTANDIAYLKDSGEPWKCGECSHRPSRTLRSNSTSSTHSKSRSGSEPATAEQVAELLLSMKSMASDMSAIKVTQEGIRSELHLVNKALTEHSKIISDHSAAIAAWQVNFEEQSSVITVCQSQIDALSGSGSKMSNKLESLELKLQSLQSCIDDAVKPEASAISTHSNFTSNEAVEKIKRSHNIIVAALPENPEEDQQVRELVDVIRPMSSQAILSISRLGLARTQSSRPRLIRVTFSNMITPRTILRNKSALLTSKFKDVSVRDDKTMDEIRQLENLRKQLKSRLAAGEPDLTIKYVKGIPSIVNCHRKN